MNPTMNGNYYTHQQSWAPTAPQEPAPPNMFGSRYPAEYQPAATQNYLPLPHPGYRVSPPVQPQGYNYPNPGSRRTTPDHGTLPTPAMFDQILEDYILSLSPKKRDKALITRQRYSNILGVLQEPKCTTIESAQFRHWAKKMFVLGHHHGMPVVLHRDRDQMHPVAVREELYDVLTEAHLRAQHGGRDKTALMVKHYWSWVPKELIARFVRYCPACSARRGSPSKARMQTQQQVEEQKFKQESMDHGHHHYAETTTPPPADHKYEHNPQHQQYHGYPTPANSPSSTTQSTYSHLMMPSSAPHMQPEQQWDISPYGSMSVQY